MANLKEIRNRITSVSSTMQITSAMKMVSAAKLKKAQDAITAMRPYASTLTELIQNLSGALEGDAQNPYTEVREKKAVLIVAITSNRGLCGAFNANIIKKTRQLMTEHYANQKVSLLTVGKKGSEPRRASVRGSWCTSSRSPSGRTRSTSPYTYRRWSPGAA